MLNAEERRRIELTASARDADAIPKVSGAGEVIERDGWRVQVMHNGVLVEEDGYYGAWMTELIRRLRGHHEPQEEAAFHAVVQRLRAEVEAPVMLELGSYWAYYSLWLQRVVPKATCVLVEPDPRHVQVGRRNLALNAASARLVQAAVGLPDGARRSLVCESDGIARPTDVVSVDGLVSRERLARVDVLLCDIQGGELEMLHGAEDSLAKGAIRFLVISTHHHSITGDPATHQRCLKLLTDRGAHLIAEHTVAESYSGDGLIVASMDRRDADLSVRVSRARARDSLFGEVEPALAEAVAELRRVRAERDDLRAQLEQVLGLRAVRWTTPVRRLRWRLRSRR